MLQLCARNYVPAVSVIKALSRKTVREEFVVYLFENKFQLYQHHHSAYNLGVEYLNVTRAQRFQRNQ